MSGREKGERRNFWNFITYFVTRCSVSSCKSSSYTYYSRKIKYDEILWKRISKTNFSLIHDRDLKVTLSTGVGILLDKVEETRKLLVKVFLRKDMSCNKLLFTHRHTWSVNIITSEEHEPYSKTHSGKWNKKFNKWHKNDFISLHNFSLSWPTSSGQNTEYQSSIGRIIFYAIATVKRVSYVVGQTGSQ